MDETQSLLGSDYNFGDLNGGNNASTAGASQAYGQSSDTLNTQLGAIFGGYLGRRVDIDLAKRWQSVGTPGISTDQAGQNPPGVVVTKNGTIGLNIGSMMPLFMFGALLYLALNR